MEFNLNMKLIKTKIKDCYLIKLNKFNDERGYLQELFVRKFLKIKVF